MRGRLIGKRVAIAIGVSALTVSGGEWIGWRPAVTVARCWRTARYALLMGVDYKVIIKTHSSNQYSASFYTARSLG